jgi:hypothetical protein
MFSCCSLKHLTVVVPGLALSLLACEQKPVPSLDRLPAALPAPSVPASAPAPSSVLDAGPPAVAEAGVSAVMPATSDAGQAAGAPLTADAGAGPEAAAAPDGGAKSSRVVEASISVFEPEGAGCRWSRVELPAGERQVLATMAAPCDPANEGAVWFHERTRALLRLKGPSLWQVSLESGKAALLPVLPLGELSEYGFDQAGNPVALTLESKPDEKGDLHFETQVFHPRKGAEGKPALAHAFVLGADSQWQHREVKLTDVEWDHATGVTALDAAQLIGVTERRSSLDVVPQGDGIEERALVNRLNGLFRRKPAHDDDQQSGWIRAQTSPPSYIFMGAGESPFATGLLALTLGDEVIEAPGLPPIGEKRAFVHVRNPFILLATPERTNPRVYDVRTGRLAFRSETGGGVVYWPWR